MAYVRAPSKCGGRWTTLLKSNTTSSSCGCDASCCPNRIALLGFEARKYGSLEGWKRLDYQKSDLGFMWLCQYDKQQPWSVLRCWHWWPMWFDPQCCFAAEQTVAWAMSPSPFPGCVASLPGPADLSRAVPSLPGLIVVLMLAWTGQSVVIPTTRLKHLMGMVCWHWEIDHWLLQPQDVATPPASCQHLHAQFTD